MIQTFFEIEGEHYKLKYQRIKTDDGELYQGILFFKNAIAFSYTVKKDKTIFFDNKLLDENFQKLIVKVIERREKVRQQNAM